MQASEIADDEPPSGAPRGWPAHLVYGALGFAVAVLIVGLSVRPIQDSLLEAKLAEYERQNAAGSGYEILFFGSSRIFRGIIPGVFDNEMEKHGHRMRSFNFGYDGMLPHEVNAFMRRVLAIRAPRLALVVVELADWDAITGVDQSFTTRLVSWHDWTETRSALRSSWSADETLAARTRLVWRHIRLFAARKVRLGVAVHTANDANASKWDARTAEILAAGGFARFTKDEYETGFTGGLRKLFLRDMDAYLDLVRAARTPASETTDLEPYNLVALRDQIAVIRNAGASALYILPPGPEPAPHLQKLAADGHLEDLLSFADPLAYPQLFRSKWRFDRRHLNLTGAREFSRIVAAEVSNWLESHEGPSRVSRKSPRSSESGDRKNNLRSSPMSE